MTLPDSLRSGNDALQTINRDEVVARYKRLRLARRYLNDNLVQRLSKSVIDEGGKKLGLLHNGMLVFDTEDETFVLMDYCLYDVRRKGRNAIEQYLIDCPPDPDSDEMVCLRAMQHAIYSLFLVESVERGLGVVARDLLSNETVLVVDMGFGETAVPGLVFASRLLIHDGFTMTGGATLPVSVLPPDQRDVMRRRFAEAAPDDDGAPDPANLIRACLRRGSSSHVRYEDPSGPVVDRRHVPERTGPSKVGRNELCPCGSGKKYKHCCLDHG